MKPICILICLALVGCDKKDRKKDLLLPGECESEHTYAGRRDYGNQIKSIDTKLFMIAENLERIALALEKK